MHELSLARALFKQVDEIRRQRGADRVVAIRLSVGEFSGAEPALLRSAFADLSVGTALESARFQWNVVRLEARCDHCGVQFLVERFRFACSACGSKSVTVTRGDELMLDSVTVECEDR